MDVRATQVPCTQCGAGLPNGVTGPLCDACALGLSAPPAPAQPELSSYRGLAATAGSVPGVPSRAGVPLFVERRRPRRLRPSPYGTWAILVANLAFFAATMAHGGVADRLSLMQLGKSNEQMWRGELWRFVTPMFVHIGPVHFLLNGILLFFFAPLLEQLIGTARLLILYMVAGICGVIAGYCFHDQFSAGASGAIFGVFAGILAFLVVNRTAIRHVRARDIWAFAGFIALISLLTSFQREIDNWAHMGGFAGGFLCGLALVPRLPGLVPRPRLRIAGAVALASLMILGVMHGNRWMAALKSAEIAYLQGDLPKARAAFERAVTLRFKPVQALIGLARVSAREGRSADAEKALKELRQAVPDDPAALYYLAELYRDTGRAPDALRELEAAYAIQPHESYIYKELARTYLDSGDVKRATEILAGVPEHAFEEDPIVEYYLGDALRRSGQIEKGSRHLTRYEHRLRDHAKRTQTPVSLNNLAWYLFEEGRDLGEALKLATRAVEKDPSSPYFLGTQGCILYQLERHKEAIDRLEKALARHTSRAQAATDLYFAAMCTAKLGQKDVAKKYLQMAEEADPRNRYLGAAKRLVSGS